MSSTNTNAVGKEVEELLSAEPNKTSTIQEELNKQLYPEIGMAAQHTSEKVEENEEEGIHPEDNSTEAICMRFLICRVQRSFCRPGTSKARRWDVHRWSRCYLYETLLSSNSFFLDIEGLCPNCEKNGINRLLMVNIPNFKEIIITSFECIHHSDHHWFWPTRPSLQL